MEREKKQDLEIQTIILVSLKGTESQGMRQGLCLQWYKLEQLSEVKSHNFFFYLQPNFKQ